MYGHNHLLTLNMENEKYRHYSSLESSVYDSDAIDMLSHSPMISEHIPHFIYSLQMMRYGVLAGSL